MAIDLGSALGFELGETRLQCFDLDLGSLENRNDPA